jgi:hypothetical protein
VELESLCFHSKNNNSIPCIGGDRHDGLAKQQLRVTLQNFIDRHTVD